MTTSTIDITTHTNQVDSTAHPDAAHAAAADSVAVGCGRCGDGAGAHPVGQLAVATGGQLAHPAGSQRGLRHRFRALAVAEEGMTTVEYAVGSLAAAALAAVLIAVVKSGAVRSALTDIITTALHSVS